MLGVYISFLSTEEDIAATHLVVKREKDDDSFALKKGNTKYPFVDAKQLFDFFGIDYVNKSYYFELTREDSLDAELSGEVYRVFVRINEKSNPNEEEQ